MDTVRANAVSLVNSHPDAIVAIGGRVIPVLLGLTRTVPIVVPGASDPVGTGWIDNLARPGRNVTGFTFLEFSIIGKMLEVLKQVAPAVSRVTRRKDATREIPVLFVTGFDPVRSGFVASLNWPGGNVTGVNFLVVTTVAKRLELLSELVPAASTIGTLVNPNNPNAAMTGCDGQAAADALGKKLILVRGGTEHDIDAGFAALVRDKAQAVLVETDQIDANDPERP